SVVAIALLLAGCRSAGPLPPLPEVSTSSFLPIIRQSVDAALADAKAHPNDPGIVGRLGMTLHAYQQLAGARACYRRASLLEPGNFDWLYYLAVVSDGQASIDALRAALRLRDYLPAKLRLGEAL